MLKIYLVGLGILVAPVVQVVLAFLAKVDREWKY